jgi:hypothetical protein
MDVNGILFDLYSELRRIDRAILALQELAALGNARGKSPLHPGGDGRQAPQLDLTSDPLPS